jgi:hypothetical protein
MRRIELVVACLVFLTSTLVLDSCTNSPASHGRDVAGDLTAGEQSSDSRIEIRTATPDVADLATEDAQIVNWADASVVSPADASVASDAGNGAVETSVPDRPSANTADASRITDAPISSQDGSAPDIASAGGADARVVDSTEAGSSTDIGACVVEKTLSAEESRRYVPFAVGDRWTYRGVETFRQTSSSTEFQQMLAVTGTQTMDGTQVLVLTDLNEWSGMTDEYLEVTASGLINHGAAANGYAPDEVQGAPPYTEVALPVQVCSVIDQFTTVPSNNATSVTSAAVERALESTVVPAGTFANSLRIERTLFSKTYVSISSLSSEVDVTDWYAPGIGRVRRLVHTASEDYSYDLTGALVGGLGRGVIPLGTIADDVAIADTYSADDVRPAVVYDGSKFLTVAATSTDFEAGGLHGVFVGRDGLASSSFPIIQKVGAPVQLAAAYGDGRYLVVYQVMNGGFYGLLVSADGVAIGNQFLISKGTTGLAVTYGAGVFMVAHTDANVLTLTPITSQGAIQTDSQPYPGQTQIAPALAFDGANFLVAWENQNTDRNTHISAGRVDNHGRAIDVAITSVSQAAETEEDVDVVFDGTNYVIAWFQRPVPSYLDKGTVRVARISTDGILLDSGPTPAGGKPVSTTDSPRKRPRIARLGSQTLVVWEIGPMTNSSGAWYRLVGTRVDTNGVALDTSPANEGLWLSAQMTRLGNQPVVPEIAYGEDRSLLVFVGGQSGGNVTLEDTLIFPW